MIQSIAIILLFAASIAYLGRLVFKAFQSSGECASGCGKCAAVDFNKIQQQLKEKGL
jgi:hypothetical protein